MESSKVFFPLLWGTASLSLLSASLALLCTTVVARKLSPLPLPSSLVCRLGPGGAAGELATGLATGPGVTCLPPSWCGNSRLAGGREREQRRPARQRDLQ